MGGIYQGVGLSYLLIYSWLCWVFLVVHRLFVAARVLSLVAASGGYSLAVVHWLLIAVASFVVKYKF